MVLEAFANFQASADEPSFQAAAAAVLAALDAITTFRFEEKKEDANERNR